MTISDEELTQAVALYREHGSYRKAAVAGGMPTMTMHSRVKIAAERGLMGFTPVLPGFAIKQTSEKVDGAWVKQTRESGEIFEVPAGQAINGVSALVDADGREMFKWIKTSAESKNLEHLISALEARFAKPEHRPYLDIVPTVKGNDDLMSVYPIADQHHGLLAWGRETGEDYDLKIGAQRLRDCAKRLIGQSPPSSLAIILNLGDWQHTDDSRNVTPGHGHGLDVDSRYYKIVETGVDLLVDVIELALQKHEKVIVRNIAGNHDPHSSVALTIGIRQHYRNNPRIEVVNSPSDFFYHRFGKVLIGATHGHKLKPANMAMDMAVTQREDWAKADYRHFFFGHIHHESAVEVGDVRVESFQSLASKDAYGRGAGFNSGRSLTSITFHSRDGEIGRHRVNIPPPRAVKSH
jgi:predicted phosphodiesterase